ncbi:MAG: VWA domain-containing protein [Rikenellaceae bacterium]
MEFTRFENIEVLWLLLIIVPMLGYYILRQKRGGVAIKLSSTQSLHRARHTYLYWLRHLPFVFLCSAIALIILAAARPQSSSSLSKSTTEGIDIVMALDISSSMLARDFKPDRFQAAKEISSRFILDRQNDRLGLVVFAGEAYTQSPLTTDQNTLVNLLAQVEMGVIADGTAIGNGLTTAVNRLRNSESPSKVIVLLTDGENNSGQIDPLTAAELAKEFGIRVYTIGVGTIGTAPYPAYDAWGDIVYQNMEVKIDDELLTNISEMTGGKYFRATDNDKLQEIYTEINSLEKAKVEVENSVRYTEHFALFLLWGLASLLLMVAFEYIIIRKIP